MDIKHEILDFEPSIGGILVRYYTDNFPSGFTYNIDLPVVDGKYPTEEEIQEIIKHYEPRGQIERALAIESTSVPASLLNLVKHTGQNPETKAVNVRLERDELLKDSDFSQLPDVPFSEIEKQAWASYRQQLRDITEQEGFPENVIFPKRPDEEPR